MSVCIVNPESLSRFVNDAVCHAPLHKAFACACSHGYALARHELVYGLFLQFLRDARLVWTKKQQQQLVQTALVPGSPDSPRASVPSSPRGTNEGAHRTFTNINLGNPNRFAFPINEAEQLFVVAKDIEIPRPETASGQVPAAPFITVGSFDSQTSSRQGTRGSTNVIQLNTPEGTSAKETTAGFLDFDHFVGALLLIAAHRLAVPDVDGGTRDPLWIDYFNELHSSAVALFHIHLESYIQMRAPVALPLMVKKSGRKSEGGSHGMNPLTVVLQSKGLQRLVWVNRGSIKRIYGLYVHEEDASESPRSPRSKPLGRKRPRLTSDHLLELSEKFGMLAQPLVTKELILQIATDVNPIFETEGFTLSDFVQFLLRLSFRMFGTSTSVDRYPTFESRFDALMVSWSTPYQNTFDKNMADDCEFSLPGIPKIYSLKPDRGSFSGGFSISVQCDGVADNLGHVPCRMTLLPPSLLSMTKTAAIVAGSSNFVVPAFRLASTQPGADAVDANLGDDNSDAEEDALMDDFLDELSDNEDDTNEKDSTKPQDVSGTSNTSIPGANSADEAPISMKTEIYASPELRGAGSVHATYCEPKVVELRSSTHTRTKVHFPCPAMPRLYANVVVFVALHGRTYSIRVWQTGSATVQMTNTRHNWSHKASFTFCDELRSILVPTDLMSALMVLFASYATHSIASDLPPNMRHLPLGTTVGAGNSFGISWDDWLAFNRDFLIYDQVKIRFDLYSIPGLGSDGSALLAFPQFLACLAMLHSHTAELPQCLATVYASNAELLRTQNAILTAIQSPAAAGVTGRGLRKGSVMYPPTVMTTPTSAVVGPAGSSGALSSMSVARTSPRSLSAATADASKSAELHFSAQDHHLSPSRPGIQQALPDEEKKKVEDELNAAFAKEAGDLQREVWLSILSPEVHRHFRAHAEQTLSPEQRVNILTSLLYTKHASTWLANRRSEQNAMVLRRRIDEVTTLLQNRGEEAVQAIQKKEDLESILYRVRKTLASCKGLVQTGLADEAVQQIDFAIGLCSTDRIHTHLYRAGVDSEASTAPGGNESSRSKASSSAGGVEPASSMANGTAMDVEQVVDHAEWRSDSRAVADVVRRITKERDKVLIQYNALSGQAHQMRNNFKQLAQQMEIEHTQQVQKLRAEQDVHLEAASDLVKSLRDEIASLEESIAKLRSDFDVREANYDLERRQLFADLADEKARMEKVRLSVAERLEEQEKELQTKFETDVAALKDQHKEECSNLMKQILVQPRGGGTSGGGRSARMLSASPSMTFDKDPAFNPSDYVLLDLKKDDLKVFSRKLSGMLDAQKVMPEKMVGVIRLALSGDTRFEEMERENGVLKQQCTDLTKNLFQTRAECDRQTTLLQNMRLELATAEAAQAEKAEALIAAEIATGKDKKLIDDLRRQVNSLQATIDRLAPTRRTADGGRLLLFPEKQCKILGHCVATLREQHTVFRAQMMTSFSVIRESLLSVVSAFPNLARIAVAEHDQLDSMQRTAEEATKALAVRERQWKSFIDVMGPDFQSQRPASKKGKKQSKKGKDAEDTEDGDDDDNSSVLGEATYERVRRNLDRFGPLDLVPSAEIVDKMLGHVSMLEPKHWAKRERELLLRSREIATRLRRLVLKAQISAAMRENDSVAALSLRVRLMTLDQRRQHLIIQRALNLTAITSVLVENGWSGEFTSAGHMTPQQRTTSSHPNRRPDEDEGTQADGPQDEVRQAGQDPSSFFVTQQRPPNAPLPPPSEGHAQSMDSDLQDGAGAGFQSSDEMAEDGQKAVSPTSQAEDGTTDKSPAMKVRKARRGSLSPRYDLLGPTSPAMGRRGSAAGGQRRRGSVSRTGGAGTEIDMLRARVAYLERQLADVPTGMTARGVGPWKGAAMIAAFASSPVPRATSPNGASSGAARPPPLAPSTTTASATGESARKESRSSRRTSVAKVTTPTVPAKTSGRGSGSGDPAAKVKIGSDSIVMQNVFQAVDSIDMVKRRVELLTDLGRQHIEQQLEAVLIAREEGAAAADGSGNKEDPSESENSTEQLLGALREIESDYAAICTKLDDVQCTFGKLTPELADMAVELFQISQSKGFPEILWAVKNGVQTVTWPQPGRRMSVAASALQQQPLPTVLKYDKATDTSDSGATASLALDSVRKERNIFQKRAAMLGRLLTRLGKHTDGSDLAEETSPLVTVPLSSLLEISSGEKSISVASVISKLEKEVQTDHTGSLPIVMYHHGAGAGVVPVGSLPTVSSSIVVGSSHSGSVGSIASSSDVAAAAAPTMKSSRVVPVAAATASLSAATTNTQSITATLGSTRTLKATAASVLVSASSTSATTTSSPPTAAATTTATVATAAPTATKTPAQAPASPVAAASAVNVDTAATTTVPSAVPTQKTQAPSSSPVPAKPAAMPVLADSTVVGSAAAALTTGRGSTSSRGASKPVIETAASSQAATEVGSMTRKTSSRVRTGGAKSNEQSIGGPPGSARSVVVVAPTVDPVPSAQPSISKLPVPSVATPTLAAVEVSAPPSAITTEIVSATVSVSVAAELPEAGNTLIAEVVVSATAPPQPSPPSATHPPAASEGLSNTTVPLPLPQDATESTGHPSELSTEPLVPQTTIPSVTSAIPQSLVAELTGEASPAPLPSMVPTPPTGQRPIPGPLEEEPFKTVIELREPSRTEEIAPTLASLDAELNPSEGPSTSTKFTSGELPGEADPPTEPVEPFDSALPEVESTTEITLDIPALPSSQTSSQTKKGRTVKTSVPQPQTKGKEPLKASASPKAAQSTKPPSAPTTTATSSSGKLSKTETSSPKDSHQKSTIPAQDPARPSSRHIVEQSSSVQPSPTDGGSFGRGEKRPQPLALSHLDLNSSSPSPSFAATLSFPGESAKIASPHVRSPIAKVSAGGSPRQATAERGITPVLGIDSSLPRTPATARALGVMGQPVTLSPRPQSAQVIPATTSENRAPVTQFYGSMYRPKPRDLEGEDDGQSSRVANETDGDANMRSPSRSSPTRRSRSPTSRPTTTTSLSSGWRPLSARSSGSSSFADLQILGRSPRRGTMPQLEPPQPESSSKPKAHTPPRSVSPRTSPRGLILGPVAHAIATGARGTHPSAAAATYGGGRTSPGHSPRQAPTTNIAFAAILDGNAASASSAISKLGKPDFQLSGSSIAGSPNKVNKAGAKPKPAGKSSPSPTQEDGVISSEDERAATRTPVSAPSRGRTPTPSGAKSRDTSSGSVSPNSSVVSASGISPMVEIRFSALQQQHKDAEPPTVLGRFASFVRAMDQAKRGKQVIVGGGGGGEGGGSAPSSSASILQSKITTPTGAGIPSTTGPASQKRASLTHLEKKPEILNRASSLPTMKKRFVPDTGLSIQSVKASTEMQPQDKKRDSITGLSRAFSLRSSKQAPPPRPKKVSPLSQTIHGSKDAQSHESQQPQQHSSDVQLPPIKGGRAATTTTAP